MLLGDARTAPRPDAPALLLIKARLEHHQGESSAPALGLMLLGAVARAWSGWDVRALDLYLERDEEQAIEEALGAFPPKVVGVSALTSESHSLHRVVRIVRERAPDALILVGGPYPSASPEECLANEAIDGVAVGEGEVTLCEVLELLERGADWRKVPGIISRGSDGTPVAAPERAFIEDIDLLPMPAWDLTDIDAYAKRRGQALTGRRRYLPLMTSRGCPFRCTYCHNLHGRRFRGHSPEYVLRLVDHVGERHGVFHFDVIDDVFNFDAERLVEICDGLIARDSGVRLAFSNGLRGDRMTPELADKLADAGTEYVGMAIETASPRLQKQIRKNLRVGKLQPVIERLNARGVMTCGFFMLGFHTETEHELRATIDFAVRSRLHAAFFFVVTPYDGTELSDQLGDELPHHDLTHGYARQKVNLSELPDEQFLRLRRNGYLRFYADPVRIARLWRAFRRKGGLPQYALITLMHTMRVEPALVFAPFERAERALRRAVERWTGRRQASAPLPSPTYVLPDKQEVPEHLFAVSRGSGASPSRGSSASPYQASDSS